MTVKLVSDYCKNVDEIVKLVEANEDSFFIRQPGEEFNFVTAYGESKLKSMFRWNMPKELKELITESIPEEDRTCDSFCINKYDPGDYLKRHRDSAGVYGRHIISLTAVFTTTSVYVALMLVTEYDGLVIENAAPLGCNVPVAFNSSTSILSVPST